MGYHQMHRQLYLGWPSGKGDKVMVLRRLIQQTKPTFIYILGDQHGPWPKPIGVYDTLKVEVLGAEVLDYTKRRGTLYASLRLPEAMTQEFR